MKLKKYLNGRLAHHILYSKRIGFILIDCFRKVPYRPKYSTMHLSISHYLSQIQWALKLFQSLSTYSDKRPTFISFGRLLESKTWGNSRIFSNMLLLKYCHWQFWTAYQVDAPNKLVYLEAACNHLGSMYEQHNLLQPARVWNYCGHVSEHNVQSPSLFTRNYFQTKLQTFPMVSCCFLLSMLLGFLFLALHILHNKPFLTKKYWRFHLVRSLWTLFPDFTFFVLFVRVHFLKVWSKMALLILDFMFYKGDTSFQLKVLCLLFFTYGWQLLKILWKNFI